MMIGVLFHVFDVDVVNIILLCLLYKHRKVLMGTSLASENSTKRLRLTGLLSLVQGDSQYSWNVR
jgi:predicted branched-subunit amino acid permease